MNLKKIRKFRSILRKFEREINLQNSSNNCFGISVAQCHTLLEVENSGEINVNELSDRLQLNKSTVSRTVEGLVSVGLIDREPDPENRRVVKINLTGQGKNICNDINLNNDLYFDKILSSLNPDQLDCFFTGFEHITDQMAILDGETVNNQ